MTQSEVQVETWTAVPGYYAEVTDGQPDGKARIRSVNREAPSGRRLIGRVLAQRVSNRGYVLVDVYDVEGVRETRTLHSLMLLAFEGAPLARRETRHFNDDPLDNRWAPGGAENCGPGKPGNLVYGTRAENDADRLRNNPEGVPRPSAPPADCSYCGERPAHARGWCARCYQRWVRAGQPESGPPPAAEPAPCPRCSRRWSRRVADAVSRWWSQ